MVKAVPGSKTTPLTQQSLQYSVRLQGGIGYTPGIELGGPADWFGPLNPQAPSAPADVAGRQWDFPSGYNLNIEPRSYEPIKFSDLRALADAYDLLRLLIETRKDQLVNLDWTIRPRQGVNGKPMAKSDDPIIQEIWDFFQSPDGENSWDGWLHEILEDLLVLDAPSIFMQRARNGKVVALQPVDGASIKRIINDWGRTPAPPVAAYQQTLHGLPAVNYTSDDLIYRPRNVRTHKVYGYSPVEQILMTVNIAIRRQLFFLEYYTDGNIPEALIGVPETWNKQQIKDFQEWFDSVLSGQTGTRRRAHFVPAGVGNTYIPTKAAALTDATDEWLARVCCFAFSVNPTPFIKQQNRATADNAQEQALMEGLGPYQKWIKGLIDYSIFKIWNRKDVEFGWNMADEQDPKDKAETVTSIVTKGLLTINQGRDVLGYDPDPNPSADRLMVLTATGYVPVDVDNQIEDKKKMQDAFPPPPALDPNATKQEGEEGKEGGDDEGKNNPPPKKQKEVGKAADAPFEIESGTEIDVTDPARKSVKKHANALADVIAARFEEIGADVARQVLAILQQKNKAAGDDDDGASDHIDLDGFRILVDPVAEELEAIAKDSSQRVLAQFGGPTANDLVDQVNQRAVDFATERAAEMVGMRRNAAGDLVPNPNPKYAITDSTRDMIRSIIARGLADNIGNEAITDQIKEQVFNEERARLIAFTEIGNANSAGALNSYSAASAVGVSMHKKWSTAKDDRVCESICLENEIQGPIDLDKPFASGHMHPLGHPRCRCRLVGVVK